MRFRVQEASALSLHSLRLQCLSGRPEVVSCAQPGATRGGTLGMLSAVGLRLGRRQGLSLSFPSLSKDKEAHILVLRKLVQ